MPEDPQELSFDDERPEPTEISESRAAYNLVADTHIGVNVRKSDNAFQAKFIGVSVLAVGAGFAPWHAQWELPWYGGALIGGFVGLIIGVFSSGIFLMVYRGWRHMQGKHD